MTEENEPIDIAYLVDAFSDDLYRFALSRVGSPALAKDFVQETFISAYQSKKDLEEINDLKSWLLTILKNKTIDHFRSVKGKMEQQTVELDYRTYFNESGIWHKDKMPSDFLATFDREKEKNFEDLKKLLDFCMAKLKDLPASIIRMKYLEEVSSKEICKTFEITSSNYWVIVHRAKLQLRDCLENRIKKDQNEA
jgi:RNA polymerase sigma factor (sigma-70 family)